FILVLMVLIALIFTLFPYTTLFRSGDGTFASQVRYGGGEEPVAVTLGDFNGDGRQDVAVADAGSREISVLLAHKDGSFGQPISSDRKSTRLNSSHGSNSYAVFCFKKKNTVEADTVGDPFKYTSSMARNPVIKLTTLFGLLVDDLHLSTTHNGSWLTHTTVDAAVGF